MALKPQRDASNGSRMGRLHPVRGATGHTRLLPFLGTSGGRNPEPLKQSVEPVRDQPSL